MIRISNLSQGKFLEISNKRKIVCFCAGKELLKICERFHIESRILYIVDNYKMGKKVDIGEYSIPVISIDEIGEEIKECLLLVSSIKYSKEIIMQLDDLKIIDGMIVYFPKLFTIDSDIEVKSNKEGVIPKTIHYCWFGKGEMPRQFKDNIESWKRNCPDYYIKKWDESNYDISKNKYMLQAYEARKWGFVPDYARLDIIYNHGGIYLDTDVEVLKSYDELLGYEMFCGFESSFYINLGLGFGAVKGKKIIREMMNVYDNMEFIAKDGEYNLTASPIFQTANMKKYGLKLNGETQIIDDMIVLSPEYLSPINFSGFGTATHRTFSIHQYASSWVEKEILEEKEIINDAVKYIYSRLE